MLPTDCLIEIFKYLKIKKLFELSYLNKDSIHFIYHVIKHYNPRQIKKYLRYSITIDNIYLFHCLENEIPHDYLHYLLRYAFCKKREFIVKYILSTYMIDPHHLCRILLDLILYNNKKKDKQLEYHINQFYFYLITKELGIVSFYQNKINESFINRFYQYYYEKFYDEYHYRWMMFKIDI